MKKEEVIQGIGKPFLMPLGILQLLLLMLFISSPFIWIWHSWDLAWKLGLTGFFGCIVVYLVYKVVKQSLTEIADAEIEKQAPKNRKSKFQQKLEEMQEKANRERSAT
jgi:hypothetical protein